MLDSTAAMILNTLHEQLDGIFMFFFYEINVDSLHILTSIIKAVKQLDLNNAHYSNCARYETMLF